MSADGGDIKGLLQGCEVALSWVLLSARSYHHLDEDSGSNRWGIGFVKCGFPCNDVGFEFTCIVVKHGWNTYVEEGGDLHGYKTFISFLVALIVLYVAFCSDAVLKFGPFSHSLKRNNAGRKRTLAKAKGLSPLLVLLGVAVSSIFTITYANEVAQIIPLSDSHLRLKKLRRSMSLRGAHADPVSVFEEMKSIMRSHVSNMQNLKKKAQDGYYSGLSNDLTMMLGDKEILALAMKDSQERLGYNEDFGMDITIANGDNDSMSDAAVAELVLSDSYQDMIDTASYILELYDDIDLALFSPENHHRRLNEDTNIFDKRWQSTDQPTDYSWFSSDSFNNKNGWHRRGGSGSYMSRNDMKRMKRATHAQHLKNFHKILHRNNPGRRLQVDSKTQRRLNALNSQCGESCDRENGCDCLLKCMKKMSPYDFAVLYSSGYIQTDPTQENYGNFTSDFNAFDLGGGGLYKKFLGIQSMLGNSIDPGDDSKCREVLENLYSACKIDDDGSQTCTSPNDQTYQLTVESVCDAVDTDIKLLAEAIYEKFEESKGNCLRVRTGSGPWDGGIVDFYVDYGLGYIKVTMDGYTYNSDEVVVDTCYDSIFGVRVSTTAYDEDSYWVGFIELSTDNKKSYSDFNCVDCCDDTSHSSCGDYNSWNSWSDTQNKYIYVGGVSPNYVGTPTYFCVLGLTCTFKHDKTVKSELLIAE